MRFLKNMRADGAPEDLAVAARLNAVTGRGRLEVSEYPFIEQRQRWSPREVQTADE
ncbi:MAG TPA: hypothetical protein VE820_05935 [Sphingomicrobium sp.]|jgi:hypothetical protein|nr:hypothetical protein [Sphingomicrobium sp.]